MKPFFKNEDMTTPVSWQPPKHHLKIHLMNWAVFKSLIWEIYDHRIANAPEINGAINTTYMTLDEHLLIFLIQKHKTRDDTEHALVQFLASLKYYS